MSKKGKEVDPSPARLKESRNEVQRRTSLAEERRKLDEDRRKLYEDLRKLDEDKRKIDEERQKLEEERRKLDEERRKSNELLRLNSTVLKAPLQQASKPTNEECDSRAEASSSSCNTQNVVACDRIKGDKNPFKQRRKSTKTSGSEDEQTKKGGEQRRKSTKTSGSEDEQTKKGGANALPVSRSVKSSEGEEEHIPSKRGGLKEASNVNTKSSSNIDTKKISSLHRKKQISSPKLSTSANNSGSKVGPNCIPELKHDGALTKSLNQSNEHMTGHEAVSKHSKSNSDKRVGLSSSQVNPENRFPVTEEAPADVQVKSKALIQSPEQKSKRPSKMEDAVLTVPLPQDTSIDFQKKESANNDTPKKKSKKSSKMEDNTEVVSITMTPMTQDSSADFLMKEAASDIEKNSKGSMSQNTRKYSRKHVKVDNVMKQSEGDGHQLTKDESNIGADYLHNLEHFDKLTASTTLMESRPQHALDETRQKEDNLIAEIEEHGKTNPPALKRKFADLEHSSVLKERVMKGKKNCASFVKPGASVKDHSSIVERQPVVVVKRLDPEIIAKMSPPKVKIVKQDNQLFLRESSQVSSTFKIPSTELFIKPSIPKKNPSVKNRVSAIAKSRNVAKRTGKPQKMSKLIESKGQKNPIEFSESNCQLSDPLSDWHKPKKSVDPMEELRADSEELDYEPGAGDDDDAMSLYADSNIFRNEDEADVSEDSLVQRQAGDSDMDSDASSDSRRLSDMEIDSDDDDHHHGIPADAQEVADDSSVVGKHTSAPSSPKESVIGIPVEVYPSSILPSKRDSVESGELVDDDDSSSHGLVETKSAKCNEEKLNKSESLVSPQQRSGKDCIGNVKDDLKGDKRRQRSLQMTRTSELSKLSSSSNTSGSSVQVPLRRPETCRTVSPFTPTQETNKISELQAPYKPFECEMGDANMLTTDFPGVYFEPPIKVCPKPPPFSHSTGHLQTPDHCIRAVPSTSVAMPLQQDNQNFNEYPEPPPPLGSEGHVMPAPILTSKSPVSLINQTAENQQLLISQFLQNMRPNGALAPTSGPKPSISTASTSNESSLGIHPINEQSRHFLMSLTDFDFRHQIDVGPRPLQSPKITDDPVDNPIGNYCSNYLTSGTCEIYDCLKIHEYPQLILDDGTKIKESIKLIEEMLSKYPHWRDKQFSSTVEMLGNLCDKISLRRIADYFWELCCDFKKKKLPEPDFNCWEQLARAYSLCGLKPAFCCKAVLGILSHRKQTIRRENYAVIDSIVDKLFDEFIMGKSDLWFCLGILAAIKDYEIPANVMREILRDTLNEPWDIVSHRAVCDYLLRSPRIEQPRKPEEPQLLHFIHKLLFALQQKEVTLQHAQKLAGYFNIDLKNDCCVDYAEKIKLYARPAVGFRSPRFTLCAFPAPFLNESSHTNQHDNLQSRVDNSVLKSASASVSCVPCSTSQNAKNGRNSQDCGAAQSSGELNLNTMEVEVQPCTEFINSMPLPAIDQDVRNLEATSVNRVVSTASNHNFSYHETAPPVRLSTDIGKVAQAPISPSSLKLKIVVDPNKEGRKIMAPLPPNQNEEPSPTTVKSSKPSRSEPEEPPLLNLIKQNKCGKAAKYIISWTQYKNNSHRILTITDTLLSQSPIVRKRNFEHLLQAIAVQMAGKLCVQMKTILITVGLGILENFLQNDLFTEAKEVHDVLWKKLNPPSVQMEKYSLSYLELITAWVCVKNEKVKEAVSIVISNSFYGSCKYWAMPSNPSDEDLRDQVCSALFHHCKELEEFVLDAETLFRYMLQSKESYKIDIAKFLDDILRALVKYAPTNRVLALLTWAHNEFNLQPHRETNRLLLCYISSLPVNSGFTPEMLFLLEQEPYNEAFPKPIQGSSRINICFQSVWNTVEVHNIFLFLLNCHLCNLPSTVQEIPLITVEIKECPLPTPAPGEFMFPHDLVEIDASVSAMQDRVLDVISDLPLRTNSRFENGVLTLDKISVHGYISKRRGAEDRLRSANQGSSREGPPFSGRMHSQYANAPYVGNQGPLNIPSAPFEANQWTENYPNMPITGYYAGDQYWGWPQQPPNLENRPYAYGHFRGQHRQGRPYHHQSYRGKQRPL